MSGCVKIKVVEVALDFAVAIVTFSSAKAMNSSSRGYQPPCVLCEAWSDRQFFFSVPPPCLLHRGGLSQGALSFPQLWIVTPWKSHSPVSLQLVFDRPHGPELQQ